MSHLGATLVSTTMTTTTTTTTTTTRSRLAQIMGISGAEPSQTSAAKAKTSDEWYIPYNGPIEPPPPRRRPRGNTFGGPDTDDQDEVLEHDTEDNTFGYSGGRMGRPRASSNAKSFASSSSHSHSHSHSHSQGHTGIKSYSAGGGSGGIGEAPVHSAASARDRGSVNSARPLSSSYSARDRASVLSGDWDREREQRGSIASFLTFGQSARRPNVSINTSRNGLSPTSYSFAPISPNAHTPGSQFTSGSSLQVQMLLPTPGGRGEDTPSTFVSPVWGRRSDEGMSRPSTRMPFHPHPQSQMQRNGTMGGGEKRDQTQAARHPGYDGGGEKRDQNQAARYPGYDGGGRRSLEERGRGTTARRGLASNDHSKASEEDHGHESLNPSRSAPIGPTASGHGSSSFGHSQIESGGARFHGRRDASMFYEEDASLAGAAVPSKLESSHQSVHPHRLNQTRTLSHSASQPVLSNVRPQPQQYAQPHPYAVAFANSHQASQPFISISASTAQPIIEISSHYVTTATTATAHPLYPQPNSADGHTFVQSRTHMQAAYTRTTATSTATVSPAAIAAALDTNSRRGHGAQSRVLKRSGNLKASISTPNLRSMFGIRNNGDKGAGEKSVNVVIPNAKRGGDKSTLKPAKTQYAAETWCDALMFPRPRFRAHVISPPSSPEETGNPWAVSKDVGQNEKSKSNRELAVSVQPPSGSSTHPGRSPPPSTKPLPLPNFHPGSFPQKVTGNSSNDPPESPAEATILRVVAEGQRRDQERQQWNELAQGSFQNRRSRSLSRTRSRKRSGTTGGERDSAMGRARADSDAGKARPRTSEDKTQGLGRSLTVGLTVLAAEAFRQPTPTISSVSHRADSNGHSRNTSESVGHKQGHTRNTSWGKAALKQLCASEDEAFSDPAASQEELKQVKLEGALMSQRTAKMHVRGRKEEAEEADVQFLDIAPLASTNEQGQTENLALEERDIRSSSQNSNASDSLDVPTVGIALSTPPNPSPVEDLPDLSTHPYAQSPIPRMHTDPVPVSASYAGPHPTSHDYNRHRLSPHIHLDSKLPGKRMYALMQSGTFREVSTPEISQTPPEWEQSSTAGPRAYAYASVAANEKRETALGLEEALLSHSFQRGSGRADGFEIVDIHEDRPLTSPHTTPPSTFPRVRRQPVPLGPYPGIPSLSHTVTTATHTEVSEAGAVFHSVREASSALSSPSSQDSSSSRMSPRPLGNIDDLEPFRDLFYKPGRDATHARTSSLEGRRMLGSRDISVSWGDDGIKPTEGLDGLRSLTRQLSEDSQGIPTDNKNGDKLHDDRFDGQSSSLPGLNAESLQLDTPLRAEYEEGQDFPEDIQSSRASSVIEHESLEETLRVGTVSLSIPEHTHQTEQRQSTALSIGDTEDDGSMRPNRDTVFTATSSLGIPGNIDDLLRTSFATSLSAPDESHTDQRQSQPLSIGTVEDGVSTEPKRDTLFTTSTSSQPGNTDDMLRRSFVTTTSSASRMSNIIGDFPIPPTTKSPSPPLAAGSQSVDS